MAVAPTRARGSNARVVTAFEATPGTSPAAGAAWHTAPFVSHTLGEERPLEEDDLLGQGREMQDPTEGVATNDGDIIVPVDVRNFGRWLKLFFGNPLSAGTPEDGYTHTFKSGAQTLPSISIEVGSPEVPAYSVNRGCRGNTMRIQMARSGKLNATLGLICIGETDPANASAGGPNPTTLPTTRFPNATGSVKRNGQLLGSVVGASFTFSNQLEKVETIQPDGRIEDSDPGMAMMTGDLTIKFATRDLLLAASTSPPTPMEISFGWTVGNFTLLFTLPRVFLPKPKRPISGPGGIQAQFNFQTSGANGNAVIVTLKNDKDAY